MSEKLNKLKRFGTFAGISFYLSYFLLFPLAAYWLVGENLSNRHFDTNHIIVFYYQFDQLELLNYTIITLGISLLVSLLLVRTKIQLERLSYFFRSIVVTIIIVSITCCFSLLFSYDLEKLIALKYYYHYLGLANLLMCLFIFTIHAVPFARSFRLGILARVIAVLALLGLAWANLTLGIWHPCISIVLFACLSISLLWQLLAFMRMRNKVVFVVLAFVSGILMCGMIVVSYRFFDGLIAEAEELDRKGLQEIVSSFLTELDQSQQEEEMEDEPETYEEDLAENEISFNKMDIQRMDGLWQTEEQKQQPKEINMYSIDSSEFHFHLAKQPEPFRLYDTTDHPKVNGQIKLPLDNGKVMVFTDLYPNYENDGVRIYQYNGYLSNINQYMLGVSLWENYVCVFVDKTDGANKWYPDNVLFSQEGTHMLIVYVEPYEGTTSFYVYSQDDDFTTIRYTKTLGFYTTIRGVYWLDESTFDVNYVKGSDSDPSQFIRLSIK